MAISWNQPIHDPNVRYTDSAGQTWDPKRYQQTTYNPPPKRRGRWVWIDDVPTSPPPFEPPSWWPHWQRWQHPTRIYC